MAKHFNELSPAEAERLAFLAEECGELVQAVCKILRHGYESANPLNPESRSNRWNLTNEMGNVRAAMSLMCEADDVRFGEVVGVEKQKLVAVPMWMHHQPPTALGQTVATACPTNETPSVVVREQQNITQEDLAVRIAANHPSASGG